MKCRRGQVALYLIAAMVIIALFLVFDIFLYIQIRGKMIIENAGDAAAVLAAQRQGELINQIGELNVEHAKLSPTFEQDKADEIVLEQRRLCLLGPVRAYGEAQSVAREEGADDDSDFSELIRSHVQDVNEVYTLGHPYDESYPGAWAEYANELTTVAANGISAACDNVEYFWLSSGHLLLNQLFYDAINGEEWCWFYFNCYDILQSYRSYSDWAPIEGLGAYDTENSEFLSLHLRAYTGALTDYYTLLQLKEMIPGVNEDMVKSRAQTWFLYGPNYESEWASIKYGFPVVSEPQRDYDYLGCAAVMRCNRESDTWIGAAKPLGAILRDERAANLVMPRTFTMSRLIPTDTAPGAEMHTANLAWLTHIRYHLAPYMENGTYHVKCDYCRLLRHWDNPVFRNKGIFWLKFHHQECRRSTGGGGSSHGGSRGY